MSRLLPDNLARQLPDLRSQEKVRDPMVYVLLHREGEYQAWLLTEYDQKDQDTAWGWCVDHDEGEWGYISLSALEQDGLPEIIFFAEDGDHRAFSSGQHKHNAVCDPAFVPMPLSQAKAYYAVLWAKQNE